MTWEYYRALLIIKVLRYSANTNVNRACILHSEIHAIATEAIPLAPVKKIVIGNDEYSWRDVVRYFSDFKIRYHSFVAAHDTSVREPLRAMIHILDVLTHIENERQDLFFYPFGYW